MGLALGGEGQIAALNGARGEEQEVAVIVVAMSSVDTAYSGAVTGTWIGLKLMPGLGRALRAPLAPGLANPLKSVAGIMTASFDSSGAGSNLGDRRPGHEVAILPLNRGYLTASWASIRFLSRRGSEGNPA